jgi:hypothetical protein
MAYDLKREEGHYSEACEYAGLAIKMINKIPAEHRGSLHALVLIMVHAELLPISRPFHNSYTYPSASH